MKIVTTNHKNEDDEIVEGGLDQKHFPYRMSDINILIDNAGCVYMLISIRQIYFVYIVTSFKEKRG